MDVLVRPGVAVVLLIWEWLRKRLRGKPGAPSLPAETVRVVSGGNRHQGWCWGTRPTAGGDVRLMAFRGTFHLTAIAPDVNVGIIRTYLVVRYWDRWRFRTVTTDGQALIAPAADSPSNLWSGRYAIKHGTTREVQGSWHVDPSIRSETDTRPVRGRAYFVDQLDNAHTTSKKVTFQFIR